jgi:antitoxin HigA-1
MKTTIKKMHNPPHPGESIRTLCFEPLGISITEAAKALGVSRKMLSQVINGRARVTPNLAVRLAKAFKTTPESWLNQQIHYDLWQEAQNCDLRLVQCLVQNEKPESTR